MDNRTRKKLLAIARMLNKTALVDCPGVDDPTIDCSEDDGKSRKKDKKTQPKYPTGMLFWHDDGGLDYGGNDGGGEVSAAKKKKKKSKKKKRKKKRKDYAGSPADGLDVTPGVGGDGGGGDGGGGGGGG